MYHHPTDKSTEAKQLQLLLQSRKASRWLSWDSYQVWLNSKPLLTSPLHVMCPCLFTVWEQKPCIVHESSLNTLYVDAKETIQASRVRSVIFVSTYMPSICTGLPSSKRYHPHTHFTMYLPITLSAWNVLSQSPHSPTVFSSQNLHVFQSSTLNFVTFSEKPNS